MTASTDAGDDPRLWLEDIEGDEALDWVRARNAQAEDSLTGTPRFAELRQEILDVLDSSDKIPMVAQRGEYLYNFWTDAEHECGLWRRTTWESYRSADPQWEVLLDLDAMSEADGVTWVWHGARVLRPNHRRTLVALSRGGSDADITREFDLGTKTFVAGGFHKPEAKGSLVWADTSGEVAFVSTDFGEGSMTTSGYPRTVRRLRRGQEFSETPEIFAGQADDLGVFVGHDFTPGFERDVIVRALTFYTSRTFLLDADDELTHIEVPDSAEVDLHREWLTVLLRDDWDTGEHTYASGAFLGIRLADFLAGSREFEVLYAPDESSSLAGVTWTRHHLVLTMLEHVVNRVEVLTPPAGGDEEWRRRPLETGSEAVPELSTISVAAVDADEGDALWLTVTGFLTPTTLALAELDTAGGVRRVEPLKAAPAYFDAGGLEVTQHFAASEDGTPVPYFQVAASGLGDVHEPLPTLLSGYGGFEIARVPSYSGAIGRAWLARGGVYVLANIRGGGEYGPRWHQAALKEKRHRAYEDFAAVARDLVARGVTTPAHLATQGGSNGGLLMGNMLTGYPELFGAIVCQVPLLDMRRYTKLLAGASWMAEYGDPDDPAQWEFIRTFSPYHRIDAEAQYPPVLFTTSTKDDRVHPGHARKMAAALLEIDADATYYENIEGGHGGAATNSQAAFMAALAYEFCWQRVGDALR